MARPPHGDFRNFFPPRRVTSLARLHRPGRLLWAACWWGRLLLHRRRWGWAPASGRAGPGVRRRWHPLPGVAGHRAAGAHAPALDPALDPTLAAVLGLVVGIVGKQVLGLGRVVQVPAPNSEAENPGHSITLRHIGGLAAKAC